VNPKIALRALEPKAPWLGRPRQGGGGFTFLNLRKDFPGGCIDWRSMEMPKLWRYNLHYFDYLFDSGRAIEDRCRLIDGWIADNPVGAADAWEPFPISLRIVNWIKFFLGEGQGTATQARLASLCRQAAWLEKNIEHHLLANHLFKNAKALLFAGLFFEGPDAARWRGKGLELLRRELPEQILPDGGHFERSPMYHSMILEDCLDLLNLCCGSALPEASALTARIDPVCPKMEAFLLGMTHPDGRIALFNDAAFGIEAEPGELAEYGGRLLGEEPQVPSGKLWAFAETGYFVMAPRPGDRLIVDCGPVGPDYQPGHSHCDTLSFELSLGGRRVVVYSGCCQYEEAEVRRYNRGNAGHNTVTLDGANQSEVWGAHRCARRAYPLYARLEGRADGSILFEGAHDGYRRLKGRSIHHRSIAWAGDEIAIEDRIDGRGTHTVESRLHLHPDLEVELNGGGVQVSDKGRRVMTVSAAGLGRIEAESGWYCPEFNKRISCRVLVLGAENAELPVKLRWFLRLNSA
jgi:uncharacterized heparinase superfamily protein